MVELKELPEPIGRYRYPWAARGPMQEPYYTTCPYYGRRQYDLGPMLKWLPERRYATQILVETSFSGIDPVTLPDGTRLAWINVDPRDLGGLDWRVGLN